MRNTNLTTNLKNGLLLSILFFFFAASAAALPSTAATNLQVSTGVTFDQTLASTLTFNAPDRAILNWNNFGSGVDQIAVAETIQYNLPGSSASVLNIVSGLNQTTINGTLESNGKVYVLNPNGIVIGGTARIDTQAFVASAVDNPFAAQFKYATDGVIPSEAGAQRSANGNVVVQNGAIIATSNITILAKDITVGGVLTGGDMTLKADGAVDIGAPAFTTWISGNLSITNPTGNTNLGVPVGILGTNGNISVVSTSGNIGNVVGSRVLGKAMNLDTVTGNINVGSAAVSAITANGKTVNVAFDSGPVTANFSGSSTNGTTVTAPGFLTLDNVRGEGASNSFTAGQTLTLGKVNFGGSASFTGSRVTDSAAGVFIYDRAAFAATAGDVVITKADHNFGPLSISATGNATVYESGTINLNGVNVKELVLKTQEGFFQTPSTFALTATKLSLESLGSVSFLGGNIANGLTINAGTGAVDLSKLSLVANLNNVAPVVTTTGTVANPVAPTP